MKNVRKYILWLFCLTSSIVGSYAQHMTRETSQLELGTIKPYPVEITLYKTTHIIFPAPIKYINLGSNFLTAQKADETENVLRVKALDNFEGETNFSIITEDGHFYSFNAIYSPTPLLLNYNLSTHAVDTKHEILLSDLGENAPRLHQRQMESVLETKPYKQKRTSHSGIVFKLLGVYTLKGKYYLHLALQNESNIPYTVDMLSFTVSDRKKLKRTIPQENVIHPLRSLSPFTQVDEKAESRSVLLFDNFSFKKDKKLHIKVYEKKGGRHQTLTLTNKRFLKAKTLNVI